MFSAFMLNAWVVASLVAVVAGAVGFFVVARGSAFAAHALPLGAFPGAAAATLLGLNSLVGLAVFSGLGAVGIARLGRHGRRDVATALSLVTLLGAGELFLSLSGQYAPELYALLFGDVLGISSGEIAPVAALSALAVAAVVLLYRPLLLNSASAELGEAQGIGRGRAELWLLTLLAAATAMALPVVGALLVFSLMVGPPATARAFATTPHAAILLSVALALGAVWTATALSYASNWPVGFFVGAISALSYGVGRGWTAWRRHHA